jgi:hypothetical protein
MTMRRTEASRIVFRKGISIVGTPVVLFRRVFELRSRLELLDQLPQRLRATSHDGAN